MEQRVRDGRDRAGGSNIMELAGEWGAFRVLLSGVPWGAGGCTGPPCCLLSLAMRFLSLTLLLVDGCVVSAP